MLIWFNTETCHVSAQIGTKRGGSTNETQDKKGRTARGTLYGNVYIINIGPFVVFDGTYDGTLNNV